MKLIPRKTYKPLHNLTLQIQFQKLGNDDIPAKAEAIFRYLERLDNDLAADPTVGDEERAIIFGKEFDSKILEISKALDTTRMYINTYVDILTKDIESAKAYKSSVDQAEAHRLADSFDNWNDLYTEAKIDPLCAKLMAHDRPTQRRLKISQDMIEIAATLHEKYVLGSEKYIELDQGRQKLNLIDKYGSELMGVNDAVAKIVGPIKKATTREVS